MLMQLFVHASINSNVHHSPDINECADSSVSMCGPNGMCVNTNGSFLCECFPGFGGDICLGEWSTEVKVTVMFNILHVHCRH